MRRLVIAVAAAIALSLGCADGATANLDTDGFAFDSNTTYCEGVRDPKAPLQFNKELVTSAGKCPIALEMTATIHNADPMEVSVDWAGALASGDVAQSLFPRVVDATSGSPSSVIASLVRACKSGSNCATDADVVVPAGVENDATATGPFDDDNHKALGSYVFKFPGAAIDHIVVAKVVLPGDPQLNISAIEFLTFQRVQSSGDAAVPGTVKPNESQDRYANGAVGSEAAGLTSKPSKPSHVQTNATGTDPAGKRKKHGAPPLADETDLNPSIYRLTDAAKQATSVRFSQAQHPALQQLQRPWSAPPSNQPFAERSSEIAPPPREKPRDLTMPYSDVPASQASSTHTSFSSVYNSSVSETMSLSSLHHSEASDRSSFSGLHDSNVGLPDEPRSSPRVHDAR